MADKGKSPRISVSLSPDEQQRIQELADRLDRSLSWIAAQAIRALLADEEAIRKLSGTVDDR